MSELSWQKRLCDVNEYIEVTGKVEVRQLMSCIRSLPFPAVLSDPNFEIFVKNIFKLDKPNTLRNLACFAGLYSKVKVEKGTEWKLEVDGLSLHYVGDDVASIRYKKKWAFKRASSVKRSIGQRIQDADYDDL